MITIRRMLPVISGDRVIVPGTEPASNVTSISIELAKAGFTLPRTKIVDLKVALKNIPGTRVEYIDNVGTPKYKFLVFPDRNIDCPSPCETDWYKILGDLAEEVSEQDVAEIYKECASIDLGDLYGS